LHPSPPPRLSSKPEEIFFLYYIRLPYILLGLFTKPEVEIEVVNEITHDSPTPTYSDIFL
jgi:hypothetical protein